MTFSRYDGTKTPVSKLQEYCQKCGKSAQFMLTGEEGMPHAPRFKYTCQVDGFVAEGEAGNKKKAKHNAAQMVLDLLKVQTPPVSAPPSIPKVTRFQIPKQVEFKEANPIGSLQELAVSRGWGAPEYKLVRESGPPHNKEFVITCTVNNIDQSGTAATKKSSKKLAATNMFMLLQKTSMDRTVAGFDECKDINQTPALRNGTKDRQKDEMVDPIDRLEKLAKEIIFEVKYIDSDRKTISGLCQSLILLCMKKPVFVHGIGKSIQESRNDAARNGVRYLEVFEAN